jgi:hypothetical protein
MIMNFTITTVDGFKKLETENEQLKEIFFLYGLCLARLAHLEHYFLHFLRHNRFVFKFEETGKAPTNEQSQKFEKHYEDAATLKMIVNDFKAEYDTSDMDDLLTELYTIRNLLAHKYMKYNWLQLDEKMLREEIYEDLMYCFDFLNTFEASIGGRWFHTKAKDAHRMRWKGNSAD